MSRFLSALVLSVLCPMGWAQAPSERVDLDAVIALAREASPRIALERQSITTAEAERQLASARPNPVFSYGRQARGNPLSGTGSQQDVSVELPLLIGGRREARLEAADRGIALAKARVVASTSQLVEEVGSAFIALLAAQERASALAQAILELERLAEIVSHRRESGMASHYDVVRMELELAAWRSRQTEADADRTDRQSRLASLVGLANWRPQAQGEFQPWILDLDLQTDLSRHPALLALQGDRALAQANLELARLDRLPGVSLHLGRSWGGDHLGASGSAGFAVEIPLLDTRVGLTHRAASELRAAVLRGQVVATELAAELDRHTAIVRQRAFAFERNSQTVSPRLAAVRQMAEDAYRLGRGSLVDLLDSTRVRHEARLDQLDQIGALMDSQWRIRVIRGDLLPRSR